MYLKVLLYMYCLRSNSLCYIFSFVIKMDFFPLIKAIKTECTRIMNMVFQNKIMVMKKSSFSSAIPFNL